MYALRHLILASTLTGLALAAANPISANPLASRVGTGTPAELDKGMIEKVHGWHCRKKKGWYRGERRWHRHWRACRDQNYAYYPRYRRYPPLPYYASPYGPYYDEWEWERRNWLWD